MSGNSNVQYYLAARGIAATPELVRAIMEAAKKSPRLLSEPEILDIVGRVCSRKTTGVC
jgi:hypothetical protein